MLGSVAGDIIGSRFEWNNVKTKDFGPLFTKECKFTDDTVMTLALADSFLNGCAFQEKMVEFYNRYPDVGYGKRFKQWCNDPKRLPYESFGNGSAMRTSAVAWTSHDLTECKARAKTFARPTHNHNEGIRGAKITAGCIWLARQGKSKDEIKKFCQAEGYELYASLDDIRPTYTFDVTCQGSVPWAIQAFLEGENFEDVIRNAISIGGDSDTIACIAGSIAEPFFGVDEFIEDRVYCFLDDFLIEVLDNFRNRFVKPSLPF